MNGGGSPAAENADDDAPWVAMADGASSGDEADGGIRKSFSEVGYSTYAGGQEDPPGGEELLDEEEGRPSQGLRPGLRRSNSVGSLTASEAATSDTLGSFRTTRGMGGLLSRQNSGLRTSVDGFMRTPLVSAGRGPLNPPLPPAS